MAYSLGWDAEPGNAMLLFETGDADAALAALDRVLGGTTWFDLQRRGFLLAHAARMAAVAGRRASTLEFLTEIENHPERWPQPAIRALTAEARAALCQPGQSEAFQLLNLARQLWTSAGSDYHAGRVRLLLASALLAAGDKSGARTELSAVRLTADRIGSRRLSDQAAAGMDMLASERSAKDKPPVRTVTAA